MNMANKSAMEKTMMYDRILKEIMDEHAPLLTKHIRVKHSSPWYNQELNEYKKLK